MNKKLISALFVGALLLGSTSALTSCKDYDDDINDLQTQIDKKALQSDVDALKTQLSAAQATATAAKTTAESALAAAQKANDAVLLKAAQADLDAAVKRIAALETAAAKLDDFSKRLDAQDATIADAVAKLNTEFTTLKADIMDAIGSMITEVSLFASYCGNDIVTTLTTNTTNGVTTASSQTKYFKLNLKNGTVVANTTFGDNEKVGLGNDLSTVDKAGSTQSYTGKANINFENGIVIRVNPTNATFTKDQVKILDSKGRDLSSIIEVTAISAYTDLLTAPSTAATRTVGNNTGLWKINYKFKENFSADDFNSYTKSNGNYILFAVAIDNTSVANRSVASSYDLVVDKTVYAPTNDLYAVTVNNKSIQSIHNRYLTSEQVNENGLVTKWTDGTPNNYRELTWKPTSTAYPTPSVLANIHDGNYVQQAGVNAPDPTLVTNKTYAANADLNDNRNALEALAVGAGSPITIAMNNSAIQYYYVTLDEPSANQSQDSEWAAWSNYTYTGLKTITEGGKSLSITVSGVSHDIIGFRVFAVNYDGTYVDPDGKAFYVEIGKAKSTAAVAGNFTANINLAATSVADVFTKNTVILPLGDVTFAALGGTGNQQGSQTSGTGVILKKGTTTQTNTLRYQLLKSDSYKSDDSNNADDWTKAKYIAVQIDGDITEWEDDATYTATIDGKYLAVGAATGTTAVTLNTINLSLTKKLPTTFPSNFGWKQGQLVGNVLTCYLYPTSWNTAATATTTGSKNMTEICDNLDANYSFVFANAQYKADPTQGTEDLKVTSATGANYPVVVNKDFINSEDHLTNIYYVYAGVSSDAVTYPNGDVNVLGKTITTKFACILNTTLQTYAWTPAPAIAATSDTPAYPAKDMTTITYGNTGYIGAQFLSGANAYDPLLLSKAFGTLVGFVTPMTTGYYVSCSVKLVNDNGVADYFTATYGKASAANLFAIDAKGTKNAADDPVFKFVPIANTHVFVPDTITETLVIELTDAFGHTMTYRLPVTITKLV